MNYVRRAGRFVRKKIGHHHHHHHRHNNHDRDGYACAPSEEVSHHSSTYNGSDTWSGEDPEKYLHSDAVTCVKAVGPELSLSGSKDNSVILYNYKKRCIEAKWTGHTKEVTKVVHAGDAFYSGSRDKTIQSWSRDRGDPVNTYTGHDLVVTGLDVSQGGDRLVSGSRDNSIKLWDVETHSCIRSVSISRNLVTHLELGRERPIIVQTSEDKELHMWDSSNLSVMQTFRKKLYIQTCCSLSPDEMYCVTASNGFGGNGCEATLWDLRSTEPVLEYRGHHESVGACTFIPDVAGRRLVMTSSHDSTVKVWDRDTAACLSSMSLSGAGPITSIAVNHDNTFLVSSFNRGIILLRLVQHDNGELQLVINDVF